VERELKEFYMDLLKGEVYIEVGSDFEALVH
jgi:hypothetical protein